MALGQLGLRNGTTASPPPGPIKPRARLLTFLAQGDNVLFDDAPGVMASIDIAAGVAVEPNSLTVNTTNNTFVFAGSGKITGPTGLAKLEPSELTLGTQATISPAA